MIEILCTAIFVWLFIKVFGLMFKVAWSLTKIIAIILFVMALPALIVCLAALMAAKGAMTWTLSQMILRSPTL